MLVHYPPGLRDQLFHRYEYDAENRITGVYVSDDKLLIGDLNLEEHDAHYDYYKHGTWIEPYWDSRYRGLTTPIHYRAG